MSFIFSTRHLIFDRKAAIAVVLLLVVMTSIAVLPFFVIGEDQKVGCCGGEMPVTHDSWMHYNQMNAFWRSLTSGIVYPRWDEHTHGYGAPTTSFYPPGIYYLTAAVHIFARDWKLTWAGFYWLTMLASAAAIFVYARQWLSRGASIVAAAIYVFAPYHLLNQYQRGAMSEFTSFIWIPLCLLFADKLLNDKAGQSGRLSCLVGLAASFGAFLWTHPPTAYQFLLVFGCCYAVLIVKAGKWRESLWLTAALVFGSMLAAAYFYPAIAEQALINSDDVERTWPYHASYVFDYSQKVYDRIGNPFFVRLDRIWVFNLALILICFAVVLKLNKHARLNQQIWIWISAGLLASFLMTKFSEPIGRLIPKIEIGVYAWRMLTLISFAMAILVGAIANRSRFLTIAALFGVLAMSGWYVAYPMWRGQSFEPNYEHYNYSTLPRGASRENPPMPPVQLATGKGSISIERWTPEFRQLRAKLNEADQLQFRTRNFAGWTATVNGQVVAIREGSVNNILFDLPAGDHLIVLEFRSTPIRRAGNWITAISFALLFSIIIKAGRPGFRVIADKEG
ncbi:MAG: 6-pyruvoyl-tetrahydropterin synthase-related protein [Blastocatellales bacterium]